MMAEKNLSRIGMFPIESTRGIDMRRLLLATTAVVAFAVPTSLAAMAALPGTAGAATAPTCKKLSGSVTGGTITITSCKPKGKADKAYKTATGAVSTLESGSGNLTWNGGATTGVTVSFTQDSTSTCPKGDSEYSISGSVSGGSSGNTYTATGQSISAQVCVTSTLSFSLLKKTVMDL
jgi:hypothetical protein